MGIGAINAKHLDKGVGSHFPSQRLVLLGLGLLNAVLLVTAVVIGIYCAKAKANRISYSVAAPLISELNFLRNHTEIVKAKVEVQAALMKERINHQLLKSQVKQKKVVSDSLQERFEALDTEKENLKGNKTALGESCGMCLPGWTFLKSSCYYFSYLSLKAKKNWPDSRAECIREGGDLLVINNFKTQQLMCDTFPKLPTSGLWWRLGSWIGLSEKVGESKWVWVNTSDAETTYWRSGEPSPERSSSSHCAAFVYHNDVRRTWYNADCNNQELNWICEMAPKQRELSFVSI